MSRYIVTGADGFIASHLCERLLNDGHHVIAFCHYHGDMSIRRLKLGDFHLSLYWGECQSPDTLAQMPRDGIDGVFHLAAAIDVAWSLRLGDRLREGSYYWQQNVLGTREVICFAARCNARCMVMSSSEIYGTPMFTPIRESDEYNPQSPYAESKVIAEIESLRAAQRGCDIVVARPFNTYGPRQSSRSVIAKICMHAAECTSDDHDERRHVQQKGPPLELGNVETKRDWVYVSDTVDGLVRIMEQGRRGEVYNLGTGRAVTVGEAAHMAGVEYVSGRGQNRGDAEVLVLLADASKARATLGWEPQIALEDGLQRTIRSYIHA